MEQNNKVPKDTKKNYSRRIKKLNNNITKLERNFNMLIDAKLISEMSATMF